MVKGGIYLAERYEVLSKIGAGGMADVYKGKDHKLNRFVAIKVLKKEFREDETFVQKFRSEAQAAAGLMHPNIVNVYDVGVDRGLYFMVMELVEGITLKEYIEKKGKLSSKEMLSIAIQMANGIEAAHMHRIIHRDIKPQNIIISKEGKVKVTDFGIARAASSNTISSNVMGSVHYTSPEQARGGFSDEKSDIYSLGITMYEMVTGRVPFDGDSAVAIAIKQLQEEITPPSEFVDLPHSLEQIILKCTQKSPDRRYLDIRSLLQDMKRSLVDPEGDFVVIGPSICTDKTVMLTPDELEKIQRQAAYGRELDSYDEDEDDYDEDDYEDEDDYDEDDDYPRKKKGKNDDDMNPRMAKMMKILTIVVAVIIVFVALFLVGKATGLLKFGPSTEVAEEKSDKVKVPDLRGMTETEARAYLKEKKITLGIKVKTEKESEKYEKGQIMEQNPEAGKKVKKNSTIEVVISSELVGEKVQVPDVAGLDEATAMERLTNEGFKNVKTEFEASADVGEGEAIRTDPAAGSETTKDAQLTLWISKGEERPTVPELTGKSQGDAKSALESVGLKLGSVSEEYNDAAAGTVIGQTKKAGSKVASGTSVSITISKGPKPEAKINVPNVVGKTLENAKTMLDNSGLSVSEKWETSNETPGTVIRMDPGAGASVKPGTTITLIVSSGPENTPPATSEPEGEIGSGATTE